MIVSWMTTNKCNLTCKHCYQDAGENKSAELTTSEALKLIDEINSEPFYDITKWDMWYRGEKWFGRLTPQNYQNDMGTYYRKVMDINETSKPEIMRAFANARQIDSSTSMRLRMMSGQMLEVASVLSNVWS